MGLFFTYPLLSCYPVKKQKNISDGIYKIYRIDWMYWIINIYPVIPSKKTKTYSLLDGIYKMYGMFYHEEHEGPRRIVNHELTPINTKLKTRIHLARPLAAAKSEALNPKSETNSNEQNSKFETTCNILISPDL